MYSRADRAAPLIMASPAVIEPWVAATACIRHVLRAGEQQIAAVATHYGWPAPERMLRAVRDGDRASLWLGPDEWLLLGSPSVPLHVSPPPAPVPHSLVDVSERQIALDLAGPTAEDLLASACPLDLHIETFTVNTCTRTVFGRCEVVLWRTAEECFRLECWRSYLPYVQGMLRAAAQAGAVSETTDIRPLRAG